MKTPFTEAQFFQVIKDYNEAFFPVQIILLLLGLATLVMLHSRTKGRDRFITLSLGILWLWIGVAYHLVHFTEINNAAWGFGVYQDYLLIISAIITVFYVLRDRKRDMQKAEA